jgi:hypothetical protein
MAGHDWVPLSTEVEQGLLGVKHITAHSYQALLGLSHTEIIDKFVVL